MNCYLADSSDPFMQIIRECDSGKSSHSIKRMACRCTAQLQRSLASDDKSQNLHSNASISVEGGFEQAPETDTRHYRTCCCSSFRVRFWSGKCSIYIWEIALCESSHLFGILGLASHS